MSKLASLDRLVIVFLAFSIIDRVSGELPPYIFGFGVAYLVLPVIFDILEVLKEPE